jgi:hypothetical protein
MTSLCKWVTTVLKIRTRVFPSGKPKEKVLTLRMKDPTWKLELLHFKELIKKNIKNNFNKNIWINDNLNYIKQNRN